MFSDEIGVGNSLNVHKFLMVVKGADVFSRCPNKLNVRSIFDSVPDLASI